MATDEQVQQARERLEERWISDGACGTCGWHALLYEHYVDEADIRDALDNDAGTLRLSCVSKDDDESWSHRGVRIFIGEDAERAADK